MVFSCYRALIKCWPAERLRRVQTSTVIPVPPHYRVSPVHRPSASRPAINSTVSACSPETAFVIRTSITGRRAPETLISPKITSLPASEENSYTVMMRRQLQGLCRNWKTQVNSLHCELYRTTIILVQQRILHTRVLNFKRFNIKVHFWCHYSA